MDLNGTLSDIILSFLCIMHKNSVYSLRKAALPYRKKPG